MKKFLVQSILLIIIIIGALLFANPTGTSGRLQLPFMSSQAKKGEIQINDNTIKVEVADTQDARKKGLGGRTSLDESEGMLFIFDNADKHPFWMKGLNFSLDFVWIKGDKVVDTLQNIPPPSQGQKDSDLPIYSSSTAVDKVLELPQGAVKRFNIKVGDTIKFQI